MVTNVYIAIIPHPVILALVYEVTLVLSSHLIVVAPSKPTLNCDKFALKPNDCVVFPSLVEPVIPILSRPKLILRVKFKTLIFNQADDNNGLSLRPCAYTEIGFVEFPAEDIILLRFIPDFTVTT